MPELISSASNPLVKQIRALRQKKGREQTGLFLVEGIHHVGEAAEAGWEIETLVHAPDLLTSDFGLRLVADLSRRGVRAAALTGGLFASVAEKDNPQGLLALVRQRTCQLDNLQPANFKFGAAVVSPQDPGNVGTILRTLDAVGGDALFLLDPLTGAGPQRTGAGGGVDPYHPSSVRASMGTIFWKPVVETSFDEFVKWAKKHGFRLVGSSAHATMDYCNLQPFDDAQGKPVNLPTVLLLGSEQKGLTAEQIAACDVTVSLPMRGRASSLNLAVAAGILLYALADGFKEELN
ncbi:MAG: RNA methyltransferase TrmH family [Anaerolineaceae bacterium]|nr:MAG: RNA methyltransferase TrmH family [Anaerolineaceae bacterium]